MPSRVLVTLKVSKAAAPDQQHSLFLLQVTVFDVPTHLTDLGGSLLVLVAVLSMGMEDWVMARWDWRCL